MSALGCQVDRGSANSQNHIKGFWGDALCYHSQRMTGIHGQCTAAPCSTHNLGLTVWILGFGSQRRQRHGTTSNITGRKVGPTPDPVVATMTRQSISLMVTATILATPPLRRRLRRRLLPSTTITRITTTTSTCTVAAVRPLLSKTV